MATSSQSKATETNSALKPGYGVKEDFNVFLHNFTEKNSLRYEDFSELWRDLQMPYLFAGRIDFELRETLQYAYDCAIDLFNTGLNVQTKTCAVYLLYAVFQTQGLTPRFGIRVTMTQFKALVTFVEEMASLDHYDFVFVFTRMRMERAFVFVATTKPQGEPKKAKAFVGKMKEMLPTGLVSTFADLSMDLVEDLAIVNEEYFRVKCVATNPQGNKEVPHPSVDLAKPEFIRDITRQLAKFDNWRKTGKWKKKSSNRKRTTSGATNTSESEGDNASDSDSAPEQTEEAIGDKRSRIKSKAFSTVSQVQRSTRYRQMLSERSQSDDPPTSPVKTRRTIKKGEVKTREATLAEKEQLAITNEYLKVATAPGKTTQRRRKEAKEKVAMDTSMSQEESDF